MSEAVTDIGDSVDVERRFGGLARLYGDAGAARIRAAHVVVVGIGGVGSWTAEALARSGVGRLTLIDLDHVAESNVNRQIHALTDTLGMAKIEAMRRRIAQINPQCQINTIDDFVTPDNWTQMVPADADVVIDACDDARAKLTLALWSRQFAGGFVCVGASGGKRLAHAVDVADLRDVTHDPLLATLRQRLRKAWNLTGKTKQSLRVTCVFSREAVARTEVAQCDVSDESSVTASMDNSLNCAGYGSAVSVTATFGMVAAGVAMNFLAGLENRHKNPL